MLPSDDSILDQINGLGVERYPDGGIYKGQFIDGVRSGLGLYLFATGQRYYGQWHEGLRHGWGVEVSSTGQKFDTRFDRLVIDLRQQTLHCESNCSRFAAVLV